jgi:hypothetical protein
MGTKHQEVEELEQKEWTWAKMDTLHCYKSGVFLNPSDYNFRRKDECLWV